MFTTELVRIGGATFLAEGSQMTRHVSGIETEFRGDGRGAHLERLNCEYHGYIFGTKMSTLAF